MLSTELVTIFNRSMSDSPFYLYVIGKLQILGLEICADTIVGDEMQRGISGGQRKRVTTGYMFEYKPHF